MNEYRAIFFEISSHMIQGIMMHDQLYRLFLFLRLYKFAKFHKKQYREEDNSYKKLHKYYICKQNKFIEEIGVDTPSIVIPPSWNAKTRFDISPDEIRDAVRNAIETWADWERKTKELYSVSYMKLFNSGYTAEAEHIVKLLQDVDEELSEAEDLLLWLKAIDYDIIELMDREE